MAAEYKQRIGARIAQARDRKHWTQPRLAREVEEIRRRDDPDGSNIDSSTISRWERGRVEPNAEMKGYLAEALEVDVSYFVMDEPDKSETPDPFKGENGAGDDVRERLANIESIVTELLSRARGEAPAPPDQQEPDTGAG